MNTIMLFFAVVLSFPLFAGEVSICDRNTQIKETIIEEIEFIRLRKNDYTPVYCSRVASEELASIKVLVLGNKSISSVRAEDFAGLDSVEYLDIGDNQIRSIPVGFLNAMTGLRQIYLAKNPLSNESMGNLVYDAYDIGVAIKNGGEGSSDFMGGFSSVDFVIKELKDLAKNRFYLPLSVSVEEHYTSEQEALLVRQLMEIRRSYLRSSFDFYQVQVTFGSVRVADKEPKQTVFDAAKGTLFIEIKDGRTIADTNAITQALAGGYNHKKSWPWYNQLSNLELEKVLRKDLNDLEGIEQDLKNDINSFGNMLDSVHGDGKSKTFFSTAELNFARLVQARVMLNLHRVMRLLVRWQNSEKAELLLAWGSLIYRTYSDWYLREVVMERKKLFERNDILKILDQEVDEGEIQFYGRRSAYIPEGSIRKMMFHRLDGDFKKWLRSFRNKDIKDVRILRTEQIRKDHRFSGLEAIGAIWEERIKSVVQKPAYVAVAGIATWLGDTRLNHNPPAVTPDQAKDLLKDLRPGDILLARQDHYLSNAFLPGFWPHAMIYLGNGRDWLELKQKNGVALGDDLWIQKNVIEKWPLLKQNKPVFVEALSEGVVVSDAKAAMKKDYLAVLRPELGDGHEGNMAEAIKQSFKYLGRPYDFDFDYGTDAKVVCTELVYLAYNKHMNFLVGSNYPQSKVPGVKDVMGRNTMPADEIGKYALYMLDNPAANDEIEYPGRRMQVMGLYMKESEHAPSKIYTGEEAIEKLRATLQEKK